jgi:6-phosphogluconolactonase
MNKIWIPVILSICLNGCASMKNKNSREILYVGTSSESGIHVYEFDREQPALKPLHITPALKPTFLAVHPNGKYLYSVNRGTVVPGQDWGSVAAWVIGDNGKLTLLNEQSTQGKDPNHISLDQKGEWGFVTNFRGDNIAVFPIHKDGALGAASDLRNHAETAPDGGKITPHPHSIIPSPDSKYLYAQNLGTDKIITYTLDRKTGKLSLTNHGIITPKGSGPRHLIFHPNGLYAYLAEELSSTVSSYQYNRKTGELTFMRRLSTLPVGYSGTTKVAEIKMHPNEKFLYVTNRGHDSVAIYGINPENGHLSFIKTQPALGSHPRGMLIDSTGKYLILANERSDNVVMFRVDEKTGDITPAGVELKVPAPTFLQLLKLE